MIQYSEARSTKKEKISKKFNRDTSDFLNSPNSRRKGQQNGIFRSVYHRETKHKSLYLLAGFLNETSSRIPKSIQIDKSQTMIFTELT